jgi:hypothetical protein
MTDTLYNMKKGYEKVKETVTEFIDPDWGDKVNSGRLPGLAGRYDNPMSVSTLSHSQGL